MTSSVSAGIAGDVAPLADAEFRILLVDSMPHLRAFARSLSGHRDISDDLTQEALIKAWAARHSYRPNTNFKAWIFTILRNQFFNDRRKMGRVVDWDEEAMGRRLVTQESQSGAMEIGELHRALFSLPSDQREALILVGAGGFSYEEAATVASCAVGTIKSRVNRARQNLEKLMQAPREDSKPKPSSTEAVADILADLDRLAPSKL